MITLVWLILVFKLGPLVTTFLMKKFLKQTFLGVIQSEDEEETEKENSFELKYEQKKQFTREDTESGIELKTELGPAKRFDGSDKTICEELFGKLNKVGNLTSSFSGEKLSHLVRGTGEGDGWTVPAAAVTSEHLNQYITRHLPEVRTERVAVGSFLEKGIVPLPRTEEQRQFGEVLPIGVQEDYLPTKVTYDEIKICPNIKTKQDDPITRLGIPKTSLEEHEQQEISKSESHRVERLNDGTSVEEDCPKPEWEFRSDSDHPFTPLWDMWIGRNSRASINQRFSKHPSDKELPPSEIDNHKTHVKDKFMLGTRKGSKREVKLIPDQELARRTYQRGSNGLLEEQLQFEEGLKKDAKMFKDFLVTDEPLLEDERLSLVGSSTSSDEDTDERFEDNIFNFYAPTTRSSCMVKLNKNTNDPNNPVIPVGIPLRRSSTTMKLDKLEKAEPNKFQMNHSSYNDKYEKKPNRPSSVKI